MQGEVNLVFSEAVAAKAAAELKAAVARKAAAEGNPGAAKQASAGKSATSGATAARKVSTVQAATANKTRTSKKPRASATEKVVARSRGVSSGRERGLGNNREQLGTVTWVLTVNLGKIPEQHLSDTLENKATFLLLLHGTGVLPQQEVVVKALTMVPNRSFLLTPLVAYLLSLGHYPEAAVAALVTQAKPEIGGKLMQSAAQLIVMRHSAEIEAKGRAAVLIILLRQKFKSVPRDVARRVAQASSEELDRWALRVLTAESPEAVVA